MGGNWEGVDTNPFQLIRGYLKLAVTSLNYCGSEWIFGWFVLLSEFSMFSHECSYNGSDVSCVHEGPLQLRPSNK